MIEAIHSDTIGRAAKLLFDTSAVIEKYFPETQRAAMGIERFRPGDVKIIERAGRLLPKPQSFFQRKLTCVCVEKQR